MQNRAKTENMQNRAKIWRLTKLNTTPENYRKIAGPANSITSSKNSPETSTLPKKIN
jgi:hypothetical protein